jgi:hypothetical protein
MLDGPHSTAKDDHQKVGYTTLQPADKIDQIVH